MALVAHKYMTEEMSDEELRATFAAREHTLDFLVDRLREQTHSKTLTSFLITGPRGSGKTTLVLMLCSRISEDEELRNAWLPVRFPEELQGISSLRDLLVASLQRLAEDHGITTASQWHEQSESEMDDEQSLELAISGLRQVSAQTGKRMILFVENLDQVFDRKLDEGAQATLRRLLMVDPFLMMVGTSVRMFEAVQKYQEPFFNYFSRVPLERLNDEQVYQVLSERAGFDGSEDFEGQYRQHKPKIQAITRLTGGNPRLLLLLYEVLSEGKLGSTVTALRQVVDELTPLLKDILENQFTEQQSKILDALMRAGGNASPKDLAKSARMSPNTVTTQLQRLKDLQVVEVHGGGKGKAAYYSVPDQLFRTWYQLRYLRPNKRRIEVFVEVLRLWFEEEARLDMLRRLASEAVQTAGKTARDQANTAEYFAASLEGSRYAPEAEERLVSTLRHIGGVREAAFALSDLRILPSAAGGPHEAEAYARLGAWYKAHGDLQRSVEATGAAASREPEVLKYQLGHGVALWRSGDYRGAFDCFDRVARASHATVGEQAQALFNRGVSKGMQGDTQGSIEDYTRVVEMAEAPPDQVVWALNNRGVSKGMQGDTQGEIEDYTRVVEMAEAPPDVAAQTLCNRAAAKWNSGDHEAAYADLVASLRVEGASVESRVATGTGAIQAALHLENSAKLAQAASLVSQTSPGLGGEARLKVPMGILLSLAAPRHRDEWASVWRSLLSALPDDDISQGLEQLGPVAEILETGDRTKLDPLPPEQRNFVEEVLKKFDGLPTEDSDPESPPENHVPAH